MGDACYVMSLRRLLSRKRYCRRCALLCMIWERGSREDAAGTQQKVAFCCDWTMGRCCSVFLNPDACWAGAQARTL